MTTHDDDALTCDTCGLHLNADKGEAFLTDDGDTSCADHAHVPHFTAEEDCPWCCTHLDAATIAATMEVAIAEGMSADDCDAT